MLLAYTISNIYQRHRLRTKKAKLDDSEVVGHDETLLFIVVAIYAIAVLAGGRVHSHHHDYVRGPHSSVLSFTRLFYRSPTNKNLVSISPPRLRLKLCENVLCVNRL